MEALNWPDLDYQEFKSTAHLLHMTCQMLGKFKLFTPFDAQWSNVALWLTNRGLTTGLIPFKKEFFSIDLDIINHKVILNNTQGLSESFDIDSGSVATLFDKLTLLLKKLSIDLKINPMPQEIVNPISFDRDTENYHYDKKLAHNWWRILLSTYSVMRTFHSRFNGKTPPIGLMWGTFDLRDARYNGKYIKPEGINAGYIRRNAMNEEQIEIGWWPGNEMYPKPAYFSFMYPAPKNIENCKIRPSEAYWNKELQEFVLDYDKLKKSTDPEKNLFDFFESTYLEETKLAGWNSDLVTLGMPEESGK